MFLVSYLLGKKMERELWMRLQRDTGKYVAFQNGFASWVSVVSLGC